MKIGPNIPPKLCDPLRNQKVRDGLESAFLSEMLKSSGPKALTGSFGGGVGEEQFSSMMNDLNADALASRLDLKLVNERGDRCIQSKS